MAARDESSRRSPNAGAASAQQIPVRLVQFRAHIEQSDQRVEQMIVARRLAGATLQAIDIDRRGVAQAVG